MADSNRSLQPHNETRTIQKLQEENILSKGSVYPGSDIPRKE